MYEKYFQLRERPFALSPDPEYLYPSRGHQEALSYLRYGVEGHAGFVVITGEIGSGKTTMLQALLGRLDRNITVARLVNTMLDPRELLEAIVLDFGIDPTGMSKPMMLQKLAEFLVQQRQARPPTRHEQADDAAEAGRVPGPAAAGRPPHAAGDRRGPEPVAAGARRDPDAVESRDREVEADPDHHDRPAGTAREAFAAAVDAAAPAHHRQLSPAAAGRGGDGELHQPSPEARGDRAAGDRSSRACRPDSRAQPRRSAHHQRHRRRDAAVRVRDRPPRRRYGNDAGGARGARRHGRPCVVPEGRGRGGARDHGIGGRDRGSAANRRRSATP